MKRPFIKPKWRDMLLIIVSVVAIYGSGHGFGYLVGSRSSQAPMAGSDPAVPASVWSDEALASLRAALDLTPDQIEAIRPDVDETAAAIGDTRRRALLEYHMLLLRLHDRIAPKVTEFQRSRVIRCQEKLRDEISRKFPASALPPEG